MRCDDDLARRIEVLEAKDEIRRLIATYVETRDVADDPSAVAAVFTSHGVWEGTGRLAQVLGRHQGPTAIAERFAGPIPPGLHLLANESITVDGDSAVGQWTSLQPAVVGGRAFWLAARYHNDFQRQDGPWRFRHVRIEGLFEAPYDEGWAYTPFFTDRTRSPRQDSGAPSGDSRITTRFGARSTAAEVVAGVDLSRRRAIVTGASSGIGVETARALASAGAEVTLAVRDVDAGERTAEDITATTGNAGVLVRGLDLADQSSVAAFVACWGGPLHILVNNAGIMATAEMRTPQGWEMQFATNHLGHFALASGLHDSLAAAGGARVVVVSSVGHINGEVRFDDINFERRPYDPWAAYRQSKTANVLFMVEANRRWAPDHIAVNALHPGRVADTNLSRHIGGAANAPGASESRQGTGPSWKTIAQGAATSVLLAASPSLDGIGGRYFEDCNEAELARPGSPSGVAAFALDPDKAARLWQVSLAMLAGGDGISRNSADTAAPSSKVPIEGSSR